MSGGDLGPWPEPIPECRLGRGQLGVEVSLFWPPWVRGARGGAGHLSHELGDREGGPYANGSRQALLEGRGPEAFPPARG